MALGRSLLCPARQRHTRQRQQVPALIFLTMSLFTMSVLAFVHALSVVAHDDDARQQLHDSQARGGGAVDEEVEGGAQPRVSIATCSTKHCTRR